MRYRKGYLANAGQELQEALSFLLNNLFTEIRMPGDRVNRLVNHLVTSDVLPTALEKPTDRFICTPDRTHNRIRSPRFAASDPQNKVGKGSRQKRSVISGQGSALRNGFSGPCLEIWAVRKLPDASRCRLDSRLVTIGGQGMLLEACHVRCTVISELEWTKGIRLFN